MNQGTDMLFIQSLAFLEKKIIVFRKNLKVDNYSYCIKPKQDKIKSSNIVEKISALIWKKNGGKKCSTDQRFIFSQVLLMKSIL